MIVPVAARSAAASRPIAMLALMFALIVRTRKPAAGESPTTALELPQLSAEKNI